MKPIYFKTKVLRIATVFMLMVTLLTINFSCKKLTDIESGRLSPEQYQWKSIEDAKSGLLGIYGLMRTALVADNAHWILGELRNGDFVATNREDLGSVINGELQVKYALLNKVTNWRRYYAVINAASLYIERSKEILEHDFRYTEILNKVDVAQAQALRAFAYFYMVRIWGDVPLITSSQNGDFQNVARTDQDQVLEFATKELLEAVKVLPYHYGGSDPQLPGDYHGGKHGTWQGVLLTKLSALSILAHIAAWQSNYIDADTYTKLVMDNYSKSNFGGAKVDYLSIEDLTEAKSGKSPFVGKHKTQIVGFAFDYKEGSASVNGHIEELTLAEPLIRKDYPEIYVNKDSIIKIFTDKSDSRFSYDELKKEYREPYFVNYSNRPVFSKIKVIGSESNADDSFSLFGSTLVFTRLEEMTLLRAEVLAVLNDLDGAVSHYNRAIAKRGVSDLITKNITKERVLDAIFAERRRELMGEGWRWYDLIRYQKIRGNNPRIQALIANEAIYWPIAKDVLSLNPLLEQNTYWK